MQKEITQEKSGDESSNGGHCHRGLERVKQKGNPIYGLLVSLKRESI